mgnify:CR=1 FL=1
MATLFVDKVDPQSGTSLEIGSSGDTITCLLYTSDAADDDHRVVVGGGRGI